MTRLNRAGLDNDARLLHNVDERFGSLGVPSSSFAAQISASEFCRSEFDAAAVWSFYHLTF